MATVLEYELVLLSLDTDHESFTACLQALLHILLLEDRSHHFVSYTRTEDEISLLLDTDLAALLPQAHCVSCGSVWRAIHLPPSPALSRPQARARYSHALAAHAISILFLSLADSDLLLVPDGSQETALALLAGPPAAHPLALPLDLCRVPGPALAALPLPPHALPLAAIPLLRALLHPPPFLSYTVLGLPAAPLATLIADTATLAPFAAALPAAPTDLVPVMVNEGPLGFTETGIVAAMSEPLAAADIPALHLSTFLTDYVLIPRDALPAALAALRTSLTVSE